MVGVAQPVERQIVVLDVAGSSPVAHPCTARVHDFLPMSYEVHALNPAWFRA